MQSASTQSASTQSASVTAEPGEAEPARPARSASARRTAVPPSLARGRFRYKPGLSPAGNPLRYAGRQFLDDDPADDPVALLEGAAIGSVSAVRRGRPPRSRPALGGRGTAPAPAAGRLGADAAAAAAVIAPAASGSSAPLASDIAISVNKLTKRFDDTIAVNQVDLQVSVGSMFGFVGPNGAGKTTSLAMITRMLRPDSGIVRIGGADVWRNPVVAKRMLGVLPDRLRLFDRLTGAEFLHHAGGLRGLDRATIRQRTADLATAFGFEHSLDRLVSDYSSGMTKKISIAAAMIHGPRVLVLDEPFESVDPVSVSAILAVLERFASVGGTVLLSSHNMGLVESVCDSVAIIVEGRILAVGPIEQVVGKGTLERRLIELAGPTASVESMEWLHTFSD